MSWIELLSSWQPVWWSFAFLANPALITLMFWNKNVNVAEQCPNSIEALSFPTLYLSPASKLGVDKKLGGDTALGQLNSTDQRVQMF